MKIKNKWLLVAFIVTVIISVVAFVKYEGYNDMFKSFKKEQPDTTTVDTMYFEPIWGDPDYEGTKYGDMVEMDSVEVWRIIGGSFKNYDNAVRFSDEYEFSDILPITEDGFYRVCIYDAYDEYELDDMLHLFEREQVKVWVLKDKIYMNVIDF